MMIVPKNWLEREQILSDAERENFLSAFAEMSLNTCKNAAGDKVQPMIFVSRRDNFFHWCLIVDAEPHKIAERLQTFAKMYFNLELKIFLSPPRKTLAELSRCWQKIYDARADSFYCDEKIFSAEDLPPLAIKIPDALKFSGRALVEALSFTDEDFAAPKLRPSAKKSCPQNFIPKFYLRSLPSCSPRRKIFCRARCKPKPLPIGSRS